MKTTILVLLLSLSACAGHSDPPPPAEFEFSHTVGGLPETGECFDLSSTCADVRLLCDGASEFAESCPDVVGAETGVYALPGAGSGRPFGVDSCVELEPCAEGSR